jgi:hypothetical protein
MEICRVGLFQRPTVDQDVWYVKEQTALMAPSLELSMIAFSVHRTDTVIKSRFHQI